VDQQELEEHLRQMRELPQDWWKWGNTALVLSDWFHRHLLGLSIAYDDESGRHRAHASGFLVDYLGKLCWFSAGHVVVEILRIRNDPKYRLSDFRWLDRHPAKDASTLPAHNKQPTAYYQYGRGRDFGMIVLDGLDELHVRSNEGLVLMTEQGWANLEGSNPEGYYVFGFPIEWQSVDETPANTRQTRVALVAPLSCLPVVRIDPPLVSVRDEFWDDKNAFYGEIVAFERIEDPAQFQPSDIVGMSGGPLLSLERQLDGRIRYRLFGVLVSWNKRNRYVRVEPIQRIIDELVKPWLQSREPVNSRGHS